MELKMPDVGGIMVVFVVVVISPDGEVVVEIGGLFSELDM
jgi:hypothetical protein